MICQSTTQQKKKKKEKEKDRLICLPLALPKVLHIANPRNWSRDPSITDALFDHQSTGHL